MISSRKASNVEAALATFSSQENLAGVACHVAKREDREKLIQETLQCFGCIDILVSNAGTNPVFGPMLDVILFFHRINFKVQKLISSVQKMPGIKYLMSTSNHPFFWLNWWLLI